MADVDLVFETPDGLLVALLPDAVPRETHGLEAIATEEEVETGIAVTDHVRERPNRYECEAVFSNSPLRTVLGRDGEQWFGFEGRFESTDLGSREALVVARRASANRPARGTELEDGALELGSANLWTGDGPITRREDSWSVLRAALAGGWLATIRTSLHTYSSMALKNAETVLEAADGTWIRVALVFGQIRQVATELVDAREPAQPRGERQRDQGSQATDEEEEAPPRSLLSQLFGGES